MNICAPLSWYEPDEPEYKPDYLKPVEKMLFELEAQRDLLVMDLLPLSNQEIDSILTQLMEINKKIEILSEEVLELQNSFDYDLYETDYREVI